MLAGCWIRRSMMSFQNYIECPEGHRCILDSCSNPGTYILQCHYQMKNVFLHTLPAMQEFIHDGKRYKTIVPLKITCVCACHKGMKRDVIDLQTFKSERLPFFTTVSIVSEKIEKNEK